MAQRISLVSSTPESWSVFRLLDRGGILQLPPVATLGGGRLRDIGNHSE
jgi:hypothetical protein